MNSTTSDRKKLKALLDQALAEARSKGAVRITELHFVLYGASQEKEAMLRETVKELATDTPAADVRVFIRVRPTRYICWNCCGLRFESDEEEAICPNCGHTAMRIPEEITFALDHIETL